MRNTNKACFLWQSAWPNGSTLACGLLGPRFEPRFKECREVAETYFTFFRSEIWSCTLRKIGMFFLFFFWGGGLSMYTDYPTSSYEHVII
jgi:hypothetical protein